jgi:hypothetical protein
MKGFISWDVRNHIVFSLPLATFTKNLSPSSSSALSTIRTREPLSLACARRLNKRATIALKNRRISDMALVLLWGTGSALHTLFFRDCDTTATRHLRRTETLADRELALLIAVLKGTLAAYI